MYFLELIETEYLPRNGFNHLFEIIPNVCLMEFFFSVETPPTLL